MDELIPGAEQIAKHRDMVERLLGPSPYEVTGAKAGPNGELVFTLKIKPEEGKDA